MKRLGGWWRLWIVLTVLWGVAAVGLVVVFWPESYEHHKLSDEEMKLLDVKTIEQLSVDFQPNPTYSVPAPDDPYAAIVNGKPAKIQRKPVFIDDAPGPKDAKPTHDDGITNSSATTGSWEDYACPVVKLPSGQEVILKPRTSVTQQSAVRQDFARVQNLLMWRERRHQLFVGFWVWVIPCLSVLAFAQTGRWVVTGFKKSPTPAPVVLSPEQNTDSRA